MGRPIKYTDDKAARLCELLEVGVTRIAASACVGISEDAFARWLKSYATFADSVAYSEAVCATRMCKIIFDAAEAGDWRAALGWLKLARPLEWGDPPKLRNITKI